MRLLSLHLGHNATAAIGVDGRVVAAVSQEKCDGVKNSAAFPAEAIAWCLEVSGLDRSDLDAVVVAGRDVYPARDYAYLWAGPSTTEGGVGTHLRRAYRRLHGSGLARIAPWPFDAANAARRRRALAEGARELSEGLAECGLRHLPVRHVEHHHCHARAAFHALDDSGASEPALILTLDGSGDGIAGSVNVFDPREGWQRLSTVPVSASLGGYYSNTTRYLGMRILEHEYKVMGLAPYAKDYYHDTYRRLFADVVDLDPTDPLTFRSRVDSVRFFEYLARNAVGERFDNIAAAMQHLLEERVLSWVQAAIERTGIDRLFVGGGVFMNVKLNKAIQELPQVRRAHFMPSCGDESNPFGAIYASEAADGVVPSPLPDLYLGPAYPARAIERAIERAGLGDGFVVERLHEPAERVADLLAKGAVVARFSGRCEWGARSLGNRAILAHPGRIESFYTVNDQIKSRDFWMPFAPTILDRRAPDYLAGFEREKVCAPFMITAFDATPLARRDLQAAQHQGDHTLRPQVIERAANPEYYDLIEAFERRTGIGGVLNTSLNLHGHPLAATPEQALFTLRNSQLPHLLMGDMLVSRRTDGAGPTG